MRRAYPVGAEVLRSGVSFRVWAPACQQIDVVLNEKQIIPLEHEQEGYFSICTQEASLGTFYQFRLNGTILTSDPASKWQPKGIFGPSCVTDASHFAWKDQAWKGLSSLKGQIIYELHVGTFTPEGTWYAALQKLPYLVELGITIIEVMPIAEFAGEFGWGYDGIHWFAPYHIYGKPDDLREFINQAHQKGIAVMLDGVYNHLGPDCELHQAFATDYFDRKNQTEWGLLLNFQAKAVRELVASNILYWVEAFHFDGIRFDAVHSIFDPSIIGEATQHVRDKVKHRNLIFTVENDKEEVRFIKSLKQGGFGLDGAWNDDFHHSAQVRLTGRREGYYADFKGDLQELLSSFKYGYLYQGQDSLHQEKKRGTASLDVEPEKYIVYLQNHDQIAHSTRGLRLHALTSSALLRTMTTVLLLAPQTPLLFQGQEFAASSPFYYFADHDAGISRSVWEGRKRFLSQFQSFQDPEIQKRFADPGDKNTFLNCKLSWEEKAQPENQAWYAFHRDLIALRKRDSVFTSPLKVDGALLSPEVCLLRFFGEEGDDRLIVCNFGPDYPMSGIAEPLYAPPAQKKWRILFASENPLYGGIGSPEVKETKWVLASHSALVFGVKE